MFYFLLLVNIIYVGIEFLFFFILLNTTSSQVSLSDIHFVEVFGRCLSAFAITFLIWKLIQSKGFSTKKASILMLTALAVAFPTSYILINKGVDMIVESTSLKTRENNSNLFLAKQGLINGTIELNTIPYNASIKDLPESKVFISNMSLFMINNNVVLNYIEKNKQNIAEHVFAKEIENDMDKYYSNYSKAMLDASVLWEEYQRANYNNEVNLKVTDDKANRAYNMINQKLTDKYNSYKRGQKYFSRNQDTKFDRYVNQYINNIVRSSSCTDYNCIRQKLNYDLPRNMKSYLNGSEGRYPSPFSICKMKNTNTPNITIFLDGKRFSTDRTRWADSNYNGMDCYVESQSLYSGYNKARNESFSKKTGLANSNIGSYEEFANQPEVKDMIINEVNRSTGIKMDSNFDASSRSSFSQAMKTSVSENFNSAFSQQINKKYNVSIPTGIKDEKVFFAQPGVQKILKDKMGSLYVEGMRPDLSKSAFKSDVVPGIIKGMAKDFVSSNLDTKEGKDIVKAMIVPPIAIFLSLFFGIINVIILIKSLLSRTRAFKKYSNIIAITFVVIMLSIPAMLKNQYTESDSYTRVYNSMKDYNLVMAEGVNWIMKTAPFIYSYGNTVSHVEKR